MARMLMSNSQVQAISRNRTEQKNLSEKLEQLNHVAYQSKDAIQQDLKTWRRFRRENVKNSGWSPKSLRPEPGEDVFSPSSGRSNTPNSPTQTKDTFTKPWAYTYSHASHNKVYKELAQVSQNSKKALDLNLKSNSIDSPPIAGGSPDSGDPIEKQPTMLKHVRTMQGLTRALSVMSVKDKLLELRQKEETTCMRRPGLEKEKGDVDGTSLLSEVGKLQKINKFSAICKLTKTVTPDEKRPVKDKLAKSVCAIKGLTKSRNLFTCSKCGGNTEVSKKGERFSNAAIAYKGLHRAQTILKLPSPQPEPECQIQPDEKTTVRRCSCNCKKQRESVSKLWKEPKAKENKTTVVSHDDKLPSVEDIPGPGILSRRRRSSTITTLTTEQVHRIQIAKEKISKCFELQANGIDAETTDMANAEQIQRSDSEGKDESNSISKARQAGKTTGSDAKPKSGDASCPINLEFPSKDRNPIENNNAKCVELHAPDITKSGDNLASRSKDTKRNGSIDTFAQVVDCFTITHSDSPLTRASRMAIDRLKMKRRSITYDELPGIKSGTSLKDKDARHRLKSDDSSLGTLSKPLTKSELKKLTKPASMNNMNDRFNIDNNTNHSLALGKSVSGTINEDSDGMPLTKTYTEEEKDGDVDHQVVMKILQEEVFDKLSKFQKRKNSTLALRKFSSVSRASTVFRNFSNRKKKSPKNIGVNVFTRIAKFMLLQVWKKRRERVVEEPIRTKESSSRNRQLNLNAKHDSFISSGRNCQVDSYERERNLFTTVDEAYSNHGTYKQRSTSVERKQGDGGYNSRAISDSACEIRASGDPATYSNTNDVTRNCCSSPHRDQPNDNSNSNRTCYYTGGTKNNYGNNNNNNRNKNTDSSSNGQTTGHVRFCNGDSGNNNDDNSSNNNNNSNKRNHNKNNKNDLRNHDDDDNNNNNTNNNSHNSNNNNNNNDSNNNNSSDINNTIPTERRKSSAAELLINAGLAFINSSNAARNESGRSEKEQSKLRLKPAVFHRGVRLFNYVSPEKRYLTSAREKAKKDPSIRWHSAVGAMVNKHEISQEPTLAERTFPKHARHRALHQMIEANHTPAPDDSLKAHNEILRTRIQTFLDSVEPFKKKKA